MHSIKKIPATVYYLLIAALLLLIIKYFHTIITFTGRLLDVLTPLLLGGIIAYILNILVKSLEHIYFPHTTHAWLKKSRRPVCIVFSLLIILSVVILIFVIVIPQLISACRVLFENVPDLFVTIQDRLVKLSTSYPALQEYIGSFNIDLKALTQSTLNGLATLMTGFFSSSILVAGTLTGWIVNFVIGTIFAIYILSNKEKLAFQLKQVMKAFAPPAFRQKCDIILKTADESFSSYITGQCTEAVILGTLCALGMWLFRLDYAGMIGTFIGATALIPIVGAYLGAVLGVIMLLTVSPAKALFFILYILVLQQLENNLIYPKVVGSSIGLPGMWVLAAVTIGGGLGGILGMVIGVPLTATLYKLLKLSVTERLAK